MEFSDRLFKNSSTTEILIFKKQLENKLNTLAQTIPDSNGQLAALELEFASNSQVRKKIFLYEKDRTIQFPFSDIY